MFLRLNIQCHIDIQNYSQQIDYIKRMEADIIQEPIITDLIKESPQHGEKLKNLFYDTKSKSLSQRHMQNYIIINPKAIFAFLRIKKGSENDPTQLQEPLLNLKAKIYKVVAFLFENFPLNCYIVQTETCSLLKPKQKVTGFFQFVLDEFYVYHEILSKNRHKKGEQESESHLYQSFQPVVVQDLSKSLFKILDLMLTNGNLVRKDLQKIPQKIVPYFYEQQLHQELIRTNYQLFIKGLWAGNCVPYVYFLNSHSEALKILLRNNKWSFGKGITIFLWFRVLKGGSKSKVLWLKTEDNNQLIINLSKNNKLLVKCVYKEKGQLEEEVQICEVPIGIVNYLCIEMQPLNEGIFKSLSYQLNVQLNNEVFKDVKIQVPRFSTAEFITEFSCFHKFIGCFYSLMVTNRCDMNKRENLLSFPHGLATQEEVEDFSAQKIISEENLVCIFNVDRAFKGILINYSGESNQGCYSGGVMKQKFVNRNVGQVNALLPYLYFLNLIPTEQKQNNDFSNLYDRIFRQYIEMILGATQPDDHSLLFCLYFLELSTYNISEATIQWLLGIEKSANNFYLSTVKKFIDAHILICRGFNVEPAETEINPVQKLQLLFYLETQWKKKWNQLQGFQGWWQPGFFVPQIDEPYCAKSYRFAKGKQHYEWSVRNFLSNDYCRCLLYPIFKVPGYADLSNYSKQYIKKEISNQSFGLTLEFVENYGTNNLIFEKKSKSRFDRLKQKIVTTTKGGDSKNFDVKEVFSTDCCLIELLTNIIGELSLTRDGFLIFTMKHSSDNFDHMCVKVFKNEYFVRIKMHLSDIVLIRRRRYNQSTSAMQIKLKSGQIHLFYFFRKTLQKCMQLLQKHVPIRKNPYQYYLQSETTIDWIDKNISNYQYLMWLNDASGRSYSDITQYPVLPWVVISNNEVLVEDSHSEDKNFRDLSRNMGSIGPEDRSHHYLDKYQSYNEAEIFNQYHFGTHYSSSAIIFNYLIRVHPFSLGALTLQSGKFDVADRVFGSYHGSWTNATTSPTDIRELVPEMYTLPEMMFNGNNYDFGQTQTKQRIDNVDLPLWAHNNPYVFMARMRQMLESQYVSKHMNHWVDLIFGYKQRGIQAVKSMNIFFPLTYEDAIVVDKIGDPDERISIETQIAHFGQNPCQIIGNNPHPEKLKSDTHWQGKLLPDPKIEIAVQKFKVAKNSIKEHNQPFGSVFEGRDSILSIKFTNEQWFVSMQKHQYCLFKILDKKQGSISKELQIDYALESENVKIDYRHLNNFVPMVVIKEKIVLVGGFYGGYTHIIFLNEAKYNESFKFPHLSTITSLAFEEQYSFLYLGDSDGRFMVYEVVTSPKKINFLRKKFQISHSGRINCIEKHSVANLLIVAGEDGLIKIYNLYSLELLRTLKSPNEHPVSFAVLSTCPLYAVFFYCHEAGKIYSYSINGQFLDEIEEKSGFIYNMKIFKSSSKMDFLGYVNNSRELLMYQTPFLKQRRKATKIRKDDRKVSCIECPDNSRIFVAGSQDGFLHLIGDKKWLIIEG